MTVVNVDKVYQKYGKQEVLKNVSLSVEKGEIVGFLGPSGSGKTTLIKAIIGMLLIETGEIKVFDQKIPYLKLFNNLGYMAQEDALYEDLSGLDNILFFAGLYGWKKKDALVRAKEILTLVELSNDDTKLVKNYSGGMKKRLSLAITLFHKPELLILDEPTIGIDPVLRKKFWDEFYDLKKAGNTIILSTHVMDEAERCDKLAMVFEGKLLAYDTPENIKKATGKKSLEDAFLSYRGVEL